MLKAHRVAQVGLFFTALDLFNSSPLKEEYILALRQRNKGEFFLKRKYREMLGATSFRRVGGVVESCPSSSSSDVGA